MGQQQGYAAARMDYHDQTSSAMNYYEELGVSQEATGEEIRKAHRRLVKLMHPDAQLDQGLKGLAETQMRRLNSVVSTLLDADQRRAYDDQLRNDILSAPATQERVGTWRGLPWWLLSAAGAVVLTLVAVWLWADHLSSSFGKGGNHTIYVRPVDNPPVATVEKPPVSPEPTATPTAKVEDAHNDFPPPPASTSTDSHLSADPHDASTGISASVVPPDTHPEIGRGHTAPGTPVVIAPIPKPTQQAKTKPEVVVPPLPVSVPQHAAAKQVQRPDVSSLAAAKTKPILVAPVAVAPKPSVATEKPKKIFNLPASAVVARANTKPTRPGSSLIPPPPVTSSATRDETAMAVSGGALPALAPRPDPISIPSSRSGAGFRPRDPLEGEWVYAPKEPERRKAGFYPPEFIDLKLFSNGDTGGNLKGQYNARYVIADKPIPPEVSFQLASASKDSRKFTWQGTNGSKGTVDIHPVDDNTIRIEWRTTTAVNGPALTSGAATLVRRQ